MNEPDCDKRFLRYASAAEIKRISDASLREFYKWGHYSDDTEDIDFINLVKHVQEVLEGVSAHADRIIRENRTTDK